MIALSKIYYIQCAVLALFLSGCGGSPSSRYAQKNDGAPLRHITASDVADAVPRADPILSAGNKSPYTVRGVQYEIIGDASGYREQGIASWYGTKFNGHKTSNGEIFDVYQATAAHKTLPIPSYARVTNLDNGRSVIVRVNDRGPFHADRLIDLSYAAAVKLGYMEQGTASVEVEVLDVLGADDHRNTVEGQYRYLQLGAFGVEGSALGLQSRLQELVNAPVSVSAVQSGARTLYRVRVGPVSNADELREVQQVLENNGYNSIQAVP